MTFKQKFNITPRYLTENTSRRPSLPVNTVRFIVAHDTGNPGSSAAANVSYYERSCNDMEASAHLFVDDTDIIECVPFLTGPAEKAWHVIYNTPIDNELFGVDANDCAGGIELCYGGNIDLNTAYKRYVWVTAFSCWRYGLNPVSDITGHCILDPKRKVDPKNAFNLLSKTFEDFIADVIAEYTECLAPHENEIIKDKGLDKGVAVTILNTWLKPSWYAANETGNKNQADYIHWLADKIREGSGLESDN